MELGRKWKMRCGLFVPLCFRICDPCRRIPHCSGTLGNHFSNHDSLLQSGLQHLIQLARCEERLESHSIGSSIGIAPNGLALDKDGWHAGTSRLLGKLGPNGLALLTEGFQINNGPGRLVGVVIVKMFRQSLFGRNTPRTIDKGVHDNVRRGNLVLHEV